MIEFVMSLILTWPFVIGCVLLALATEYHKSHGWTVVLSITLWFVVYHILQLTPIQAGYALVAYLPIGIVWSWWRWKRHCDEFVECIQDELQDWMRGGSGITVATSTWTERGRETRQYTEQEKAEAKQKIVNRYVERINPSNNTDKLCYWVAAWPFSLLEMFLHDLFALIKRIVMSITRYTYQRITAKATARIVELVDRQAAEIDKKAQENQNAVERR